LVVGDTPDNSRYSYGGLGLLTDEGGVMNAEGWYTDPFGNHEARWISDGIPTALVRDGGVESLDPPPTIGYSGPFERLAPEGHTDSRDMRRADEAETEDFDPLAGHQRAISVLNKRGLPNY
jgi:hypothetical protein